MNEDPVDVRVVPGDTANYCGRLTAEKIFLEHGNPDSIAMDVAGMAMVCALAAQMVLNGASGEWQ